MGKPRSSTEWRPLGTVESSRLIDARLQLHWAVQPVMAFSDCALERLPDDSQSNLGWRGGGSARPSHGVTHGVPIG